MATLVVTLDGKVLAEIDVKQTSKPAAGTGAPYAWTLAKGDLTTSGGEVVGKGTPALTWISTAATYIGFDTTSSARGVQIGSAKNPTTSFTLSTEGYTEKIAAIAVNAATTGTATLTVKVGGEQIGEKVNLTSVATLYKFESAPLVEGKVEIILEATEKAMYLLSVSINPTE